MRRTGDFGGTGDRDGLRLLTLRWVRSVGLGVGLELDDVFARVLVGTVRAGDGLAGVRE